MSVRINELHELRLKAITEARAILDQPELTDEQSIEADKLMDAADGYSKDIQRIERAESAQKNAESFLDSKQENRRIPDTKIEQAKQGNGDGEGRASDQYRKSFQSYLRRGSNGIISDEVRALQVGTTTEGGFLVPDEFANQLVMALENQNIVRGLANVIQSTSGTMDIPVASAHGVATWTAEEAALTASDETFAQVQLSAYKADTIILVSSELVNDSAFNLEAYLVSEFARRIGALEEAAFVNGDGSAKPTGITDGALHTVDAASATAITSDEIIDVFHALGRPYRNKATWMMADATAKLLRKLKDGDSQYLWQPGLQAGVSDVLLGRPVAISDDCEAATALLKPILFGDISYYWIADRSGRTFQRLNELYAANDQIGFKATQRVDGKLTLAAAVEALQMAA